MSISLPTLKTRCRQSIADYVEEFNPHVNEEGRYIYIDNGSNILGVAHLDTVFSDAYSQHAHNWYAENRTLNRIYSPVLDDRLGAAIILDYLPKVGIEYDILLTVDEEIGKSTAQFFTPKKQYNWAFEFDRAGDDVVTYQYNGYAWLAALEEFFRIGSGSFSDIAYLTTNMSAVNIGCGYENAHTYGSYVDLDVMSNQIGRFISFYHAHKDDQYLDTDDTTYKCSECKSLKLRSDMYSERMRLCEACNTKKSVAAAQRVTTSYPKVATPRVSRVLCEYCPTDVHSSKEYFANRYYFSDGRGFPLHYVICEQCFWEDNVLGANDNVQRCPNCYRKFIWLTPENDDTYKCPVCRTGVKTERYKRGTNPQNS